MKISHIVTKMKKPLKENQVKTIRKMKANNELQNLIINLSTDLMLRASDLLKLKVSDVMFENGNVRETVKVKQKKTKNYTIDIPLSAHSKKSIVKFLSDKNAEDFIFAGQKSHYTRKAISTVQYQRIIKNWMRTLGVDDVSSYSTHSMRKTLASHIYSKTNNVEAVRRLLGHQSVTATSSYLNVSNDDATALAIQHHI